MEIPTTADCEREGGAGGPGAASAIRRELCCEGRARNSLGAGVGSALAAKVAKAVTMACERWWPQVTLGPVPVVVTSVPASVSASHVGRGLNAHTSGGGPHGGAGVEHVAHAHAVKVRVAHVVRRAASHVAVKRHRSSRVDSHAARGRVHLDGTQAHEMSGPAAERRPVSLPRSEQWATAPCRWMRQRCPARLSAAPPRAPSSVRPCAHARAERRRQRRTTGPHGRIRTRSV
jgi:hypothetical protein